MVANVRFRPIARHGCNSLRAYNVYKPLAANIGTVDGPIEYLTVAGIRMPMPFTTRMTVVRLTNGDLFLHSPVAFDASLAADLQRMGRFVTSYRPTSGTTLISESGRRRFPRPSLGHRPMSGDERAPARRMFTSIGTLNPRHPRHGPPGMNMMGSQVSGKFCSARILKTIPFKSKWGRNVAIGNGASPCAMRALERLHYGALLDSRRLGHGRSRSS